MIKIMNGLLTTTEGEVLINGMKPGIETKKIVSYLPERTYLNDWMKVKAVSYTHLDVYKRQVYGSYTGVYFSNFTYFS